MLSTGRRQVVAEHARPEVVAEALDDVALEAVTYQVGTYLGLAFGANATHVVVEVGAHPDLPVVGHPIRIEAVAGVDGRLGLLDVRVAAGVHLERPVVPAIEHHLRGPRDAFLERHLQGRREAGAGSVRHQPQLEDVEEAVALLRSRIRLQRVEGQRVVDAREVEPPDEVERVAPATAPRRLVRDDDVHLRGVGLADVVHKHHLLPDVRHVTPVAGEKHPGRSGWCLLGRLLRVGQRERALGKGRFGIVLCPRRLAGHQQGERQAPDRTMRTGRPTGPPQQGSGNMKSNATHGRHLLRDSCDSAATVSSRLRCAR
jgi:hypothetical protein